MNTFRQYLTASLLLLFLLSFNVTAGRFTNRSQTPVEDLIVAQNTRDLSESRPRLGLARMANSLYRTISLSVSYSLGARIRGDRLLVEKYDAMAYPAAEDVLVELSYPEPGSKSDSIITFVEIECQQDTDDGNARVAAGGIGSRSISIVLEAKRTVMFSYKAKIYGITESR